MLIYICRPMLLAHLLLDQIANSELSPPDKEELYRYLAKRFEAAAKLFNNRADAIREQLSGDMER